MPFSLYDQRRETLLNLVNILKEIQKHSKLLIYIAYPLAGCFCQYILKFMPKYMPNFGDRQIGK